MTTQDFEVGNSILVIIYTDGAIHLPGQDLDFLLHRLVQLIQIPCSDTSILLNTFDYSPGQIRCAGSAFRVRIRDHCLNTQGAAKGYDFFEVFFPVVIKTVDGNHRINAECPYVFNMPGKISKSAFFVHSSMINDGFYRSNDYNSLWENTC